MKTFTTLCLIISSLLSVDASTVFIGNSGSKQFYLINSLATFSEAVHNCVSNGMSIATPQTQTEFDDLIRLFTSTVRGTKKIKENFAFVGIQKFGHEWLEIQSKKTISYTMKWLPDDPSGDGLCAELFINHQLAGLNDVPCVNFYRNFLCEKVYIAPPITTQAPYQPPVNHCAELESENSELRDRIANLEREISEM